MLYTHDGIQQRVRKDLTGLDGKPGFDISGYTMRNMYLEMSKGAYDITGDVVVGCRCRTPRAGTRLTPAPPSRQ